MKKRNERFERIYIKLMMKRDVVIWKFTTNRYRNSIIKSIAVHPVTPITGQIHIFQNSYFTPVKKKKKKKILLTIKKKIYPPPNYFQIRKIISFTEVKKVILVLDNFPFHSLFYSFFCFLTLFCSFTLFRIHFHFFLHSFSLFFAW